MVWLLVGWEVRRDAISCDQLFSTRTRLRRMSYKSKHYTVDERRSPELDMRARYTTKRLRLYSPLPKLISANAQKSSNSCYKTIRMMATFLLLPACHFMLTHRCQSPRIDDL